MRSAQSTEPQAASDKSSVYVVSLDELDNAVVRTGANYWRGLKGGRKLPARSQLKPRDMSAILRNVVLVKVIDGGKDYEYRITGDAHVQAYGLTFKDLRVSQVKAAAPEFGRMMHSLYEHVRSTADPFAVRGWVGRELPDAHFVYYESAFLPLAEDGETVDHILVVSIYVPKAAD
ncbi:MAG: PAS domain-containing protein [Rhizomicrobium sp.]